MAIHLEVTYWYFIVDVTKWLKKLGKCDADCANIRNRFLVLYPPLDLLLYFFIICTYNSYNNTHSVKI